MRAILILSLVFGLQPMASAQYAPPAGQTGTTAIHKDSSVFVNWATGVTQFSRGFMDIADPSLGLVTFGDSSVAIGQAEGTNSGVVSLGDSGSITLSFQYPIINGSGFDFAIFENGFSDTFLELAFVEVSTDGITYIRFPSVSLTPENEIGGFGSLDATNLYNFAGKYRIGYGTPFDLEDIVDSTGIDINNINYVRLIDVVGTTNPQYATYDSQGNIVIDPYSTPFSSGGFDLDAIGVINENQNAYIKDNSLASFISVFPNPSYGNLNIKSIKSGFLNIYDMSGKKVFNKTCIGNETIFINSLTKGIYLIKFEFDEGIETKKIIVQ
ncbi:MAG TPA: T9SS type A sorting domain-containing protein [Crocinitomix sp.]|nr:T9SS type A sorting domain-containing protein [Crocinitomix sp.]